MKDFVDEKAKFVLAKKKEKIVGNFTNGTVWNNVKTTIYNYYYQVLYPCQK
jgi:hypothetical protein